MAAALFQVPTDTEIIARPITARGLNPHLGTKAPTPQGGGFPLNTNAVHMAAALFQFDWLRETRQHIHELAWAQPAAMVLYFGIKCAEEERLRLNVEIRRLISSMYDGHVDYYRGVDGLICGKSPTKTPGLFEVRIGINTGRQIPPEEEEQERLRAPAADDVEWTLLRAKVEALFPRQRATSSSILEQLLAWCVSKNERREMPLDAGSGAFMWSRIFPFRNP
ncbi:hypothetical protein B0H13DRAFT_2388880 [Mycena leptocephala]|nr:hypothetical protein B0H13DRAFT_2388880 [Mycena leptocephala]